MGIIIPEMTTPVAADGPSSQGVAAKLHEVDLWTLGMIALLSHIGKAP
jgi:hypothetical protein